MAAPLRSSSLPSCPLCTESLGAYGGPSTLPCGHNLCLHCGCYLQQRQALCPLCRAAFPQDLPLTVNYELRELMRMASALTAVEGEDGWQAVTSAARVDLVNCKHASSAGSAYADGCSPEGSSSASVRDSAPLALVGMADVLAGVGSVMDLDPVNWEPDSSSPVCRAPGCGKPFAFMLRPRHHCRCCGQLFCGTCTAERLLLPPKFQQSEPQRVCAACHEVLLPIQPLLAGSIAPAVRQPVHDVTDWSAGRSLLNPPLSTRLETDIYTATNILRQYVRSVGSLPSERTIPPAILRSCAGLAILSVAKAGAGWSLSVGSGLVVARNPPGAEGGGGGGGRGWSAPSALLSLASSVGWQFGVEVQDLVLVLRNQTALKAFCSSAQVGVGGAVSVAAGPVGRAAAARALASVGAGAVVYSYSSTRGAYAGVALEGQVVRTRDAVNRQFYGRPVSARQLLVTGAVAPPPAAAALYSALDALMEHAGQAAGPQFLSAASAPAGALLGASSSLPAAVALLPPAASAPVLHATAAPSSDDEWEPEEEPEGSNNRSPRYERYDEHHQRQQWGRDAYYGGEAPSRGRAPAHADVAGGCQLYPSAPSYLQDDEPQPFGCLFD